MSAPIGGLYGILDIDVTVDDTVVALADAAKSKYDDISTAVFNHGGELYVLIEQTHAELDAHLPDGLTDLTGMTQESIDVLANAVDGETTLCRETANSRFFRINWTVTVTGG